MTRSIHISRTARWAAMLAWLALAAAGLGCDRNTSPYVAGEEPTQPDLSRIFPSTGEHDHAEQSAPRARTPVAQETSRAGSARGPTISGEVVLAGEAPPGATLFVIARAKGARGGPPLAVQRVTAPSFPHAFEIGQTDVMIPNLRFEGEIDVTARLDADGNAMTKDAADLEGRAASAHVPGDSGLVITLE